MKTKKKNGSARASVLPSFITFPRDAHMWFWLAVRIIAFSVLLVCFFRHPDWYSKVSGGVTHYMKKRILFLLGLCFLLVTVPCFRLKLPVWLRIPLAGAEIFGLAFLAVYRAERVHKYNMLAMYTNIIIYNLILVLALFLVFHLITNRIRISAVLAYLLVVFFSIVNYYINLFRGEPINAADLYVVGTALNVASTYTVSLTQQTFIAFFEMATVVAVANWLPKEELVLKKWARLLYDAVILGAAVYVFYLFALSPWPLRQGVQVKVFQPMKTYKRNGEVLNFVRGFYYMKVDQPEKYSPSAARDMMAASGYVSDTPDADDGRVNPNIIFIMNESLADFSEYPSLQLNEDPLAYIHSLKNSHAANVITGDLHVDVFGGRTANTEYEVLTGNSIAFLPYNAVPYALYLRSPFPSLFWDFRDTGYCGNSAFHPYLANGYSRPRAYPNLGFEDFVSIETIESSLTNQDYIRKYISDRCDFEHVIELYEEARKTGNAPFCLFNVTMQNHGGYTKAYKNLPSDISILSEMSEADDAERYLNLTNQSDEAFELLTEYFSNVKEPTILVMFGDHLPNLPNSFYASLLGKSFSKLNDLEMFQRYQTSLVIWANYDINPNGIYDGVFDEISINYLSAAVKKLAGVPMTAYQKFLADMQEKIPVFTAHGCLDAEGNYFALDDTSSPWYDLVKEYHMYFYNYQFGKSGRQDDFFCLDTELPSFRSEGGK